MITKEEYQNLASKFGIPIASIRAIDDVESNSQGFDPETGKIKIQFEPNWFKKLSKLSLGFWSKNKVDIQSKEWEAFNDAFAKNQNKAMESTSIGRMQVMGLHWKILGFDSVGEMWDFAKKSEANQLELGLRFICKNSDLLKALKSRDWKTVAYLYNGKNYWIKKYNVKLANAEKKYL